MASIQSTTPPAASEAREARRAVYEWIALGLILGFIAFVRLRLIDFPLERDEGDYAYGARTILDGRTLYGDFHTMRLPGIYLTYAGVLAIFGQSPAGIHTALLLTVLLNSALLYLLGRRLFGPVAGLGAAGIYGVLSSTVASLGQSANSEHFINLWAILALCVVVLPQNSTRARCLLAGVALGMALLIKQHAALLAGVGWWAVLFGLHGIRKIPRNDAAARTLAFAAGGLIPLIGTVVLVAAWGVWDEFTLWTLRYAGAYVSGVSLADAATGLSMRAAELVPVALPAVALAVFGAILGTRSPSTRPAIGLILLWLLAAAGMVSIGFYFRPHYFLLLYPPLALLAGAALLHLPQGSRAYAAAAAIALCVLWPVAAERHYLFEWPDAKIARARYGINPMTEAAEAGNYIREHASPDATVLVMGSEPLIYLYSGRASATGHVHMYPLMENHPYAEDMARELIAEAEAAKPEYIVFVTVETSWLMTPDSRTEVLQWYERYVTSHYALEAFVEIPTDRPGKLSLANQAQFSPDAEYLLLFRRRPDAD